MIAFRYTFQILSLALLCTLMTTGALRAQTMNVEPGVGTLNQAIADSTADVFVLQRDGLYILDGELGIPYDASIIAEEGEGARPRIIMGVVSGGETPAQVMRPRANFTLRGIQVEGVDELGGLIQRVIRISENEVLVTVDDCWLTNATQAAFRLDGTNISIHLKNSIVSNMGRPESPENGRVFDDRGNDIDSLVVLNNTFYNVLFNTLRDGGGIIKYARYDHNTFFNTGMFAVDFGPINEAILTNNLIINGAFYGIPRPDLDLRGMIEMEEVPDSLGETSADIRNNAFYLDPVLVEAFPDTMQPLGAFDSLAQSFIDAAGTGASNVMLDEAVPFVNPPPAPVPTVESYYLDPAGAQAQLDVSGEPFDFAYSETSPAYTMATDGGPLGALTWFGISVARQPEVELPSPALRIESAYPNPFHTTASLAFRVDKPSDVRVDVYDVLGRRVQSELLGTVAPGQHTMRLDGASLSSGIYFVRLTAGADVRTVRLALVR